MRALTVLLQRILPPLWCGMVLAIGFLEAPLKFKAPGITRELGLGIGRLVFSALNNVELGIGVILALAFFGVSSSKSVRFVFGTVALILLMQTFWLIPELNQRADVIIGGSIPPESSTHIFYIIFEAAKVCLLITLSILLQWPEISKPEKI
jgi:hypothetical protein